MTPSRRMSDTPEVVGRKPRVGSLFAGVEGFGQGLEQAGFEVAWQVEIDKDAVSVLERHYPTVRRYRDVRDVNGAELSAVDVLVGGFPCQDLSVAGRRQGLAGERSGLFYEVARIAAETATPWLLLENVDGLLSSWSPVEAPPCDVHPGHRWDVEETADLGVVIDTLQEHGYLGCLRVLDAQHFGIPQRRRRVFIIGCLGDSGARAAEVLLEPESVLWDLAACFQAGQGTPIVPENSAGSGGVSDVAAFDERNVTSAANRSRCEPGLPSGTLHADGMAVAFTNRGEAVEGAHETLRAGSHGALPMVAQASVRRLMPVECERLMGWPDGHTERRADGSLIPDGPRYRMIGNDVAAPVAQWIGERLIRVMRSDL